MTPHLESPFGEEPPSTARKSTLPYHANPVEAVWSKTPGHLRIVENKVLRSDDIPEDSKLQEQQRQKYALTKQLFDEINDKYHIAFPHFDYVIASENGRAKLQTLADHIEGVHLNALSPNDAELPPEALIQIRQTYLQFIQYYWDKYRNNTPFISDFKNDQFVYGHKHNEAINQLYFVDVEPELQQGRQPAIWSLQAVGWQTRELEKLLGIKLSEIHQAMHNIAITLKESDEIDSANFIMSALNN